ncbi:MAG TPA: hypothetical protein VMU18_12420 [Rhodoblastus sp.]|nr:hypothetical protein [Rhodoblastus sp.]
METSLETFLRPDLFVAYLMASSGLMMSAAFAFMEDCADLVGTPASETPED